MGQKSLIEELLTKDQINELNRDIASGDWTIEGIREKLGGWGYEISKSSTHRYMQRIEKGAEKIRQSRVMAEAFAAEVGEDLLSTKQGHLLVEIMRTLIFDFLTKQMEEDEDVDPQQFFFLGKAIKDIAGANRLDQDYAAKVRVEIEKEERAKAADIAGDAVRAGGASEDQVAFIKAEILGISDRVEGAPGDG